jgi:recombination protein RecA
MAKTDGKKEPTTREQTEKEKAIELTLSAVEKQFGKGAIMRLGDDINPPAVEVIPTGSITLDVALGTGGLPKGRIVEIFGPESSGKTTLALHSVAESQKRGGVCAFIDAEHALDVNYAKRLGCKVADLLISQPDTGEQALEIADMLVRSNAVDLIVIDSVAALVPKAEIEGEMGDQHVGLHARLMSQALRKLTGTISKSKTCVIFINQIRLKIGVMFGSPETTTGGNALKFYASMRLDIRRIGSIKKAEDSIGNRTRVKVVKNKLSAPFKEAEFDILYGDGVSKTGEIVDLGSDLGIIDKSGAWYTFDGDRIGQGRDNARVFLDEHGDVALKIEQRIRAHFGLPPDVALPVPAGVLAAPKEEVPANGAPKEAAPSKRPREALS